MPGVCVIVAYRPKPGKGDEVLALVRGRVPNLRKEGPRNGSPAGDHALA
jgi:hypothetical protein